MSFETLHFSSKSLTIYIRAKVLKMVHIPYLAQALGLAAILPFAASSPETLHQHVQAMIDGTEDIILNPGYPWDGGYENLKPDPYADCVADMPKGQGPTVFPDTPTAFTSNPFFSSEAVNNGYSTITYSVVGVDYKAATIDTPKDTYPIGYMGWLNMASYNPDSCSQICNKIVTKAGDDCSSYNIYFLRSPTVAPAAACPSPSSM